MRVRMIAFGLLLAVVGIAALIFTAIKATDMGAFKDEIRRQVTAAIGRGFDMATADIEFDWPPRLVATGISLADAEWAGSTPMARFDRLEGEVDPWSLLIGSVRLRSLTLFDGEVRLERSEHGVGNWVLGPSSLGPPLVPAALVGLEHLTLRRISIEWPDEQSSSTEVLRIGRIDAEQITSGRLDFSGSGSWNDNPFEARLSLPNWYSEQPSTVAPRLTGKIIGVSFDISVQKLDPRTFDTFEAGFKIEGPKLSDIGMLFGIELPVSLPLVVTGNFRRTEGGFAVDQAVAMIGQSDIRGSVAVGDPEGRTRLEADLASRQLLLSDLPVIAAPMILNWTKVLDSSIDWHIDAMTLEHAELKAIPAHIESDLDGATVSVPAAALSEGGLKLDATLVIPRSKTDPEWSIRGQLDGTDLASSLGIFGLANIADAQKVSGEFTLSGPAQSLGAWLSGLSGVAHLTAGSGDINPRLVRLLPVKSRSFACLGGSLEIDRGLLVGRDWLIVTPSNLVSLQGSVDLRGGIIDARAIDLSPGLPPPSQAKTLEINGPLSAPEAAAGPDIVIQNDSRLSRSLAQFEKSVSSEGVSCEMALEASLGSAQ